MFILVLFISGDIKGDDQYFIFTFEIVYLFDKLALCHLHNGQIYYLNSEETSNLLTNNLLESITFISSEGLDFFFIMILKFILFDFIDF